METFEGIFLYMLIALLSVFSVATLLFVTSNKCCHPKSKIFYSQENPETEADDDENREESD